jgi:hypothetical protein
MLRSIAIVIALALCSLSGSSSAYAGVLNTIDKSPTARSVAKIAAKKLFSLPPWVVAACAKHYLNVKGCRDQGGPGDSH